MINKFFALSPASLLNNSLPERSLWGQNHCPTWATGGAVKADSTLESKPISTQGNFHMAQSKLKFWIDKTRVKRGWK